MQAPARMLGFSACTSQSLYAAREACGQVTTCAFIHRVEAAKCWEREKMSNRLTAHYRKVTISAHLEQEQWQLSPASDRRSTTQAAWHTLPIWGTVMTQRASISLLAVKQICDLELQLWTLNFWPVLGPLSRMLHNIYNEDRVGYLQIFKVTSVKISPSFHSTADRLWSWNSVIK
jgi:hypothetical protein